MLALAFNMRLVKADVPTVYINADGSIAPVGAPVVTSDQITYNFTGNIAYPTYYGVIVQRSNVVIDGKGYTVQGNQSGNGLYLASISNVTVKNVNVRSFVYGIYLSGSSNCTVIGNNATSNFFSGILIYSSSCSEVIGNVATANGEAGVYLSGSSNNAVTGNMVATNTQAGIALYSSSGNTISGNNATANIYNGNGIYIRNYCSNNTVSGNSMASNGGDGILLENTSNNTVIGNTATSNGANGIGLSSSPNNTIVGNSVTANSFSGIALVASSSNNTIAGNSVTSNNIFGVFLNSFSNTSSFFHNSFVNNGIHAGVVSSCVGNVWDNGYPSGGNYWSNYTGVDLYSGPYQNLTGSDGIGDTNHTINTDNVDYYPLMKAYGSIQNLNTSLIYYTIQSAINAPQTLKDHVIYVKPGTYHENVLVNKSVFLLGEDRETTIIEAIYTTTSVVQIISNNVKISGFTVQNGFEGFDVLSNNCTISGNRVRANPNVGIYLLYASNNTVIGNNATANGIGIELYFSSNNTVIGNTATTNSYAGICLLGSSNNTVIGNTATANSYDGIYLDHSSNDTVIENNASSNVRDGIHILESSANNLVSGNTLSKNGYGAFIEASSHNTIVGNVITSNLNDGIKLNETTPPCVENNITANFISGNAVSGIFAGDNCDQNMIAKNSITANAFGVYLWGSHNNQLLGNNLTANSWDGVLLHMSSTNNNVSDNTIAQSSNYAVEIIQDSNYNNVTGNNIANNNGGIYVGTNYNRIFHNSFQANNQHALVSLSSTGNVWNDSYPSGGNYWSNYTGVDSYNGPYQNLTGSDGIGDTNHTIDAGNVDHYPLMRPFVGVHEVGIANVTTSKAGCLPKPSVSQGYDVDITVKVANYGVGTETFSLTIYANTTILKTLGLTLTGRSSTTIVFTWNTTGFARDNYTISAYATPVTGETNMTDNTFVGGNLTVTLVGDVNCDGYVGIDDIFNIASHFSEDPTFPLWNPNCDINNDLYIGIDDIFTAAQHFAEEGP
jgi:parallel beta-helix repeat protein